MADHLEGALRCLAAGPEIDQQAHDNRTVTLDLNGVLTVTEQMRTTKKLLEVFCAS